jgi:Notch-like protein
LKLKKIIKLLKSRDLHGHDIISTKFLKISFPLISPPQNYICNKVLIKGIFSNRSKFSIIKPLYKKGDKKYVSNYRPISLLTSFSKIFEKVMQTWLLEPLHNNNILSREQFEFQMTLTSENATCILMNEILNFSEQ